MNEWFDPYYMFDVYYLEINKRLVKDSGFEFTSYEIIRTIIEVFLEMKILTKHPDSTSYCFHDPEEGINRTVTENEMIHDIEVQNLIINMRIKKKFEFADTYLKIKDSLNEYQLSYFPSYQVCCQIGYLIKRYFGDDIKENDSIQHIDVEEIYQVCLLYIYGIEKKIISSRNMLEYPSKFYFFEKFIVNPPENIRFTSIVEKEELCSNICKSFKLCEINADHDNCCITLMNKSFFLNYLIEYENNNDQMMLKYETKDFQHITFKIMTKSCGSQKGFIFERNDQKIFTKELFIDSLFYKEKIRVYLRLFSRTLLYENNSIKIILNQVRNNKIPIKANYYEYHSFEKEHFQYIKELFYKFQNSITEITCYLILRELDLTPNLEFYNFSGKTYIGVEQVPDQYINPQILINSETNDPSKIYEQLIVVQTLRLLHLLFFIGDLHPSNFFIKINDELNYHISLKIIDLNVAPKIKNFKYFMVYKDKEETSRIPRSTKINSQESQTKHLLVDPPSSDEKKRKCLIKFYENLLDIKFSKIIYERSYIFDKTLPSSFESFDYMSMIFYVFLLTPNKERLFYVTIEALNRLLVPALEKEMVRNIHLIHQIMKSIDSKGATSFWANFAPFLFRSLFKDVKNVLTNESDDHINEVFDFLIKNFQFSIIGLYDEIINFKYFDRRVFSSELKDYHFITDGKHIESEELTHILHHNRFNQSKSQKYRSLNNHMLLDIEPFNENIIIYYFTKFGSDDQKQIFIDSFIQATKISSASFVHTTSLSVLDLFQHYLQKDHEYQIENYWCQCKDTEDNTYDEKTSNLCEEAEEDKSNLSFPYSIDGRVVFYHLRKA